MLTETCEGKKKLLSQIKLEKRNDSTKSKNKNA